MTNDPQRMEMELLSDDEEEHSDVDNSDNDSEYTYVTDEEEEEESAAAKSRGWFSFLRRGRQQVDESDSEESDGEASDRESAISDDDHIIDDEEDDLVGTAPPVAPHEEEDDENHSTSSKEEEDILDEIDQYNPSIQQQPQVDQQQHPQDEESILMAQAIQRVQQRIQSHGGNIYNALEATDQQLVDTLRGVEDESVEVMDREEQQRKKKEVTMVVNNGGEEEGVDLLPLTEDIVTNNEVVSKDKDIEQKKNELVSNKDGSNGVGNSNNDANKAVEDNNENDDEEYSQQDDEDYEDDDEEEEGPTLEEQRSLLSLAAEHDRVDVIKELLSISQNEQVNTSLLCGFSSSANNDDDDDEHTSNNHNNNSTIPTGNSNNKQHNNKQDNDAATTTKEDTNVIFFVPPPLHAAIAHGSVNAASCLLRMGANPSIRPIVPLPYLSRNYQPSSSPSKSITGGSSSRRSSMEEDRNYKKYHEMSAWELAFGSIVILKDGEEEEMLVEEEEEVVEKRGWFGFGGSGGGDNKKEEQDIAIQQDANGKQQHRIVRRRQPLNIAPNKLEGIRHAFTAEALRAIGADEVDRLTQLLDSGMDSEMEVAGKSLVSWAIEMEADGCCDLLRDNDDDEEDDEGKDNDDDDEVDSPPPDSEESSPMANSSNDVDQSQPPPPTSTTANVDQQQPIPYIQDERLAGLSPKDILTLIQENENLIPALTTCRDDLAEETSACQNILRDIQASGGRGGLSSRSLLDLVHSLKEKRRDMEEELKNWQLAWEEREDELDFFWEEVLNDEWREHIAELGVLDDVVVGTDTATIMKASPSLGELTRRFCEVDNRVNTLRSSITSLADECSRYQAEVERVGMSGALSLTKSLREELKEMESQLAEAKSGEAVCRRKIELIQERLTNSTGDESVEENVVNGGNVDAVEPRYEGGDSSQACQGQEDVPNVIQDFAKKEMMEGAAYAEAYVQRGMERESDELNQYEEDDNGASDEGSASNENYRNGDKSIESDFVVDGNEDHNDFVVVDDTDEVPDEADEIIPAVKQEEAVAVNDNDNNHDDDGNVDDVDDTVSSEMQEIVQPAMDAGHIDNGQSHKHKIENNETENGLADNDGEEFADSHGVTSALVRPSDSELDALKPSDALQSGMSTALVVRQPTAHNGSLSLQIWDLIRRIVGLGRTPSYRTQSESSTTIMII